MNNKSNIDTYITPYDIDIVVANKYTTLEQLRELYKFTDSELGEEIMQDADGNKYQASCVSCVRKSDKKPIELILDINITGRGRDKIYSIYNTACHEATHAILDIYRHIGGKVDYDNQEIFAYNMSYIAECVLKTWLKK